MFFLAKLRNEIKCRNAQELSEQIHRDVQAAREYFAPMACKKIVIYLSIHKTNTNIYRKLF